MFIRGSPYKTTNITTVWAHTTNTLLESNFQGPMFIRGSPYKTTPSWKATFRFPYLSGTPPIKQLTLPLCGHSQPLCTLLENNFQGPMFIRGSPYKTTHIATVWALITTVYTTEKQLSGPHVYIGFPPLKQL